MSVNHISITDARKLLQRKMITIVDIRDQTSYESGHINGAKHLNNENMDDFVRDCDLDRPLIIYCFHGYASQSAAHLLFEQGFEEVYSLIGGYEAWKSE